MISTRCSRTSMTCRQGRPFRLRFAALPIIRPCKSGDSTSGAGGPGRLPARGSHRPERAQLTHSVPQVTPSLRQRRTVASNPLVAIRWPCVDTLWEVKASLVFPSDGVVTRRPASLPRVPAVRVPRLPRYYQGAMTSCRPFRRASFPSLGDTTQALVFRPHAAERCRGRVSWSWSPGTSSREWVSGDDRISYVPGEPRLCSCPALRPR